MPVNESSFASTTGALHMPGGGWDAMLPNDVLTRLTRQRPNILLVGPAAFAQAALKSVESLVPHPTVSWAPDQTRTVPAGSYATLLIHRIDTADGEQQQQLCD